MAEIGKKIPVIDAKLHEAVDTILRTEAGRRVFAHLFHLCGYNVSSLVRQSDGEIALLSTECREAQRMVYIRLRNLASYDLLRAAEELAENPALTPAPLKEK
jgi:hypothetical protein